MNDEMTPREHSEMRDSILAGAQRIHSAGQRRMQMIAASVAFVLVAGISGGAVATAALLGSGIDDGPVATPTETAEPSPTATPTLTPEPTPEPTVPVTPPAPAQAVVAFGSECENALEDADADAVTGHDMLLSDYRWQDGTETVLGGIDCLWLSEDGYALASVHVFAYPAAVVPQAIADAVVPGCEMVQDGGGKQKCESSAVVDGTWLLVQVYGEPDATDAAEVDGLFANVRDRLAASPAPVAAERTADWWELPDCAALAAGLDPALLGHERVELANDGTSLDASTVPQMIPYRAGASGTCPLHFSSGTGDSITGWGVPVQIVPGGALDFPTALAAEHAQTVDVEGAEGAVIVPGNDRYEGSWEVLVISDGTNLLIMGGYSPEHPLQDLVPLAEVLLAQL